MKNYTDKLHDHHAGKYFRRMEEFLGSENIERRLDTIAKEIRTETGIYLVRWVKPRLSWWLGLKEARCIIKRNGSFRRALTLSMEYPLSTAYNLSKLHKTFTQEKSDEIRSRILSDEILEPILLEIDTAAHFSQLGYEIEWCKNKSSDGEKTPEFIARKGSIDIEVECKSKGVDAGRRIERRKFYRMADRLIRLVQKRDIHGFLSFTSMEKIPVNNKWYDEFNVALEMVRTPDTGSVEFSDKTNLVYDLKSDESFSDIREIFTLYKLEENFHSHSVIWGNNEENKIKNPIIIQATGKSEDAFLKNVLKSLVKARKQFSGQRAAIICCMIPEIDTFDGLQENSSLELMTRYFFEKHAGDYVNAVTYVSDPKRSDDGIIISSTRPSLSFHNPNYNPVYGVGIPLY